MRPPSYTGDWVVAREREERERKRIDAGRLNILKVCWKFLRARDGLLADVRIQICIEDVLLMSSSKMVNTVLIYIPPSMGVHR